MNLLLSIAIEELEKQAQIVEQPTEPAPATNQPKHEDELVMYGKITDFEGLKQAKKKESHEQWEIKTKHGRVRVRKTTKDGLDPVFDLTFKTKSVNAGIEGNMEQTIDIDETMFNSFKQLAEGGMVKDRYCFEVQSIEVKNASGVRDIEVSDMFYEVDVYFNEDGSYNENVKIDLEVNPLLDQINANHKDLGDFNINVKVSHLPMKVVDVILSRGASESDQKIISNLYDTVFLKKK